MVVTVLPAAAATGVTQERIGRPSRCTVQAPHSAAPQPNLVPVSPMTSRSTQSRGMSGGTSTVCALPLTLKVTTTVRPPPCAVAAPSRAPASRGGHHAVAPRALRLVQRGIGARDERLRRVAVARTLRHAHAERHAPAGELLACHAGPDALGH